MTAAPLLPEIRIEERRVRRERARAFLERDRLMAAYALADIDRRDRERARWWLARREATKSSRASLVVEVLPFRPCFATGDSEGLSRRSSATASRSRASSSRHRRPGASRDRERVPLRARRADAAGWRWPSSTFRPRVTHGGHAPRAGARRRRRSTSMETRRARYFTPRRARARDLLRRVHRQTLVVRRGHARALRGCRHRGRRQRAHAARVSRSRHGDHRAPPP